MKCGMCTPNKFDTFSFRISESPLEIHFLSCTIFQIICAQFRKTSTSEHLVFGLVPVLFRISDF